MGPGVLTGSWPKQGVEIDEKFEKVRIGVDRARGARVSVFFGREVDNRDDAGEH
jgi:hypothetical protein